ncbi:MBL fold metallo-hydrolase [Candidatus Woesearchaeota archaeon]|nr:MBL fold metallo-hydrolase [Candidatus Woesearchaeota archaeon]
MKLIWLGHASFRIETKDGFVIYIDPFAGDDSEYEKAASLILISHHGYHHLGYEKVRMIRQDDTSILTNSQSAYELNGIRGVVGEKYEFGDVKVKPVHAYSLRPGIGVAKGEGLGFVVYIENRILYFAGSTDLIPEMNEIVCDIALLPVAASRTMGPEEAAEAVNMIKPKVAIPMYWGSHVGTIDDAELFKEIVEEKTDVKVLIPKVDEVVEL